MNREKVLFIGWDAADWKVIHPLIDAGKMPNLRRLVENGVMGRVATIHPALSPMLWTSIATGKRPFKHGIHGFSEPTPDGGSVQPISNLSRTAKAVWNILNQKGLRSVVVGWWPSHPAEPINGVMVSDHYHRANQSPADSQDKRSWPLGVNCVWPPDLHDTLADLRFHPRELVDPMLLPFVPALEKIDQQKDPRFSQLCRTIAECVSIHSAATWLMENRPWDFFAVYYDAIDHFSHAFMRYHPPRQDWVGEQDFELYSDVVSTAYQFHDQMLGTLLAKAGAPGGGTRVMLMSDHGFHPDHLRARQIPDMPAGPAIEHSPFGIFVMAGPGIKRDEPLHGVTVLDATPTLLTLFGLPTGEDMDGRVVTSAFETPPAAESIPSWEGVPGNDGRHPPHTRLDPVGAAEALAQLVALGYIEAPGENIAETIERTIRELRYNLMQAYQDANRHPEAVEIARDLCRRDPDEQRFAVQRFHSCHALGLTAEMREILDDLKGRRRLLFEEAGERMNSFRDVVKQRLEDKKEDKKQEDTETEIARELDPRAGPSQDLHGAPREPILSPQERKEMVKWRNLLRYQPGTVDYLEALTLTAEKRWFEALEALDRISSGSLTRPGVLLHAADLYRRLGRIAEAKNTCRAALQIDPDNVNAYLGLCRLALRRRDDRNAIEAARECLRRSYFFPMAHFLLGIARTRQGDDSAAADAFRTALLQNPHFPQAHWWMARLLKVRDPEAAREHLHYYREMRRRRAERPAPSPAEVRHSVPPPVHTADAVPLPPLGDDLLVVSGLPRSGTSMLMQMLEAGGVPVLTDGERRADEDNPRGYLEFEPARKISRDHSWIAGSRGKAVTIVAPLICGIPPEGRFRVIFMERDYEEILASQAKMIARRGESIPDSPERRERLAREYARMTEQTKNVLTNRANVRLLVLRYDDVVCEPASAARSLNAFAGGMLDEAGMTAIVDPALHRNRSGLH